MEREGETFKTVVTHLSSLPNPPGETTTKSVPGETYLEAADIGFRWQQNNSHIWHLKTQGFAWD